MGSSDNIALPKTLIESEGKKRTKCRKSGRRKLFFSLGISVHFIRVGVHPDKIEPALFRGM